MEVEPGLFSAKHWAAKSQASASDVTSVNGQTGTVVLSAADIGAVAKSGDTMTGGLEMTALGLAYGVGHYDLYIKPGDGRLVLWDGATEYIYLRNTDIGTTAGTVAAGDDSRITGALQSANVATFTQYNSATADKVLETDSVWADSPALTDGATIAVNFNDGFDFGGASNAVLLLGGNRTLSAPTNARNSKKGILWFGATGGTRTLTLDAAWNLATGTEAGPYSITTSQELGVAYVTRGTTVIVTAIIRRG